MPTYVYGCGNCGSIQEHLRTIRDRLNHVKCKECGDEMEMIIRAPMVSVPEAMKERLNRNYEERKKKKAMGEYSAGDNSADRVLKR